MADSNLPPTDNPDEFRPESLLGTTPGGAYRLQRVLGVGGMATVYDAVRLRDGLRCAFKMLLPEQATDPTALERFRREAEFARRIKSPHVVEVLDYAQPAGLAPYLAMEFLDGEDLSERLLRLGRLDPPLALVVLQSVASALMAAHEQKILHRDLKPANIYLAQGAKGGEMVKLLDFGASRVAGGGSQLTAMGMIIGTPWYVSPEQARGKELDARSDQFSLAVVLFEALTGGLPFDAVSPNEVLFKIVSDPTPSIAERASDLAPELDPIFARALSKNAADRYPSVRDFAEALRAPLGKGPAPKMVTGSTSTLVSVPIPKGRSRSNTGLSASGPGRALKKGDHRVLDVLHARGLLPFEFSRTLRNQGVPNGSNLLDHLIDQGGVDERTLLRALASAGQAKYLVTEGLRQMRIPKAALDRLPLEKARALQVLPLAFDPMAKVLTVAVSDLDATLIEKVRAAADVVRVQPALALPSAIAEVRPLRYGVPAPAPAPASSPPPAEAKPAPETAGLEPLLPLLDRGKLDRALTECRATGSPLLECVLSLELLAEPEVLRAFASAYRCRFIKSETLSRLDVPVEMLRRVPAADAERFPVLPAPSESGELRLVVPIPLDPALRTAALKWAGLDNLSLYVATPAATQAAVRKAYRADIRAFTSVSLNGAKLRPPAAARPATQASAPPPPPAPTPQPPPAPPAPPVPAPLKTMQVEALLLDEDPPAPPPVAPPPPTARPPTQAPPPPPQPAAVAPPPAAPARPVTSSVPAAPARPVTSSVPAVPKPPVDRTALVELPELNELVAATAPPPTTLSEGEAEVLVLCFELRGSHGSSTAPSKEAAAALTGLLAKAAGWVEDAEGIIESARFDGLVALWPAGAPDACRRALAVAFRLTAHASSLWVDGRALGTGIGVHQGRARLAKPGHGDLAALGPAAAIARKLAALSVGQVLVSEAALGGSTSPLPITSTPWEEPPAPVPTRALVAPANSLSLDA